MTDNPELGKRRDELHKGLCVYPSGKHLVFYLAMDKDIDVVRILHASMNILRHLG